jgi:predicted GNAT family N-acyltransferase
VGRARSDTMTGLDCRPVRTPSEWAYAMAIRLAVFVAEQGVPFDEELDEHDATAYHLLALLDARPVGTGRLVVEGDAGRIGRMAVLPAARRHGVGSALLQALLAEAERRGLRRVSLAAQLHARPFYARFGFVADGPHFLDGGLWHQRMERSLGRA